MYQYTRRAHLNSKHSASVVSIRNSSLSLIMVFRILLLSVVALTVQGAPDKSQKLPNETAQTQKRDDSKEDLKPASSSYSHQYSDWRGRYPGGYEFSVTGYGTIEDRVGANYGEIGGYNNVGYGGNSGYGVYKGYDGYGQRGYDGGIGCTNSINTGYGGSSGYGRNYAGNSGVTGYGTYGTSGTYGGSGGYSGSGGYGGSGGYDGSGGYGTSGVYGGNVGYSGNGGYGSSNSYGGSSGYGGIPSYGGNVGTGGNGGYGGYGGNGGLSSYYGYNNPYYQGNNHLGYGYYSKKTGYGNIYNNGITPSLVTGYRGYSR